MSINYTFCCQECGRKFKTTKAAEKASMNGCPKCGGCDIDVDIARQVVRPAGVAYASQVRG